MKELISEVEKSLSLEEGGLGIVIVGADSNRYNISSYSSSNKSSLSYDSDDCSSSLS